MDRGETSQDASALLLLVSVTLQSGQSLHLYVWCGVVWCGVVWCGVVWCGVVMR